MESLRDEEKKRQEFLDKRKNRKRLRAEAEAAEDGVQNQALFEATSTKVAEEDAAPRKKRRMDPADEGDAAQKASEVAVAKEEGSSPAGGRRLTAKAKAETKKKNKKF